MKVYRYLILLVIPFLLAATNFDDLDKSPDGAYKGQIFLSGTLGAGLPYGEIIDAEDSFTKDLTYTFEDSQVTKEVLITHLTLAASLDAEYMPIDYVGVKIMLSANNVLQRSLFGSDYKNENLYLYRNYGAAIGPNFHLTKRKQWDVRLFPYLGYGYGIFEAAPVVNSLYDGFDPDSTTKGMAILYGVNLSFAYYFKGGFFLSSGINWINYQIEINPNIKRTSPTPSATYNDGKTSGTLSEVILEFSVGYAYYN